MGGAPTHSRVSGIGRAAHLPGVRRAADDAIGVAGGGLDFVDAAGDFKGSAGSRAVPLPSVLAGIVSSVIESVMFVSFLK